MSSQNQIYRDYQRRRARERWRKRLPVMLAGVTAAAVIAAVGVFVLSQTQRRPADVPSAALPAVTFAASPSPLAVAAAATATPGPTIAPTSQPSPIAAPTVAALVPTRAAPAPTPQTPTTLATTSPGLDVPSLQRLMLDLINADRQANGLTTVEWDDSAAQAAQLHAEDMAAQGYFSHWNTQGWGPDVRYGLAGGTDVIRENVAAQWSRYNDGRPAPIGDWRDVIRDAQVGLMNSPGHRANILDPHHTHVGVGIAYNAATGEARIAQEFINRYIALTPVNAPINGEVAISGTLLRGARQPLINVAFEPLPTPLTPDDLNNRMPKTYRSPAKTIDAVRPDVQGERFEARVPVGQNGPGLYHIRIWVDIGGEDVPAANVIVNAARP
jgi:uncharacterized protein YkwD